METVVVVEVEKTRVVHDGPPLLLEARGISKSYGHVNALMNVSFKSGGTRWWASSATMAPASRR